MSARRTHLWMCCLSTLCLAMLLQACGSARPPAPIHERVYRMTPSNEGLTVNFGPGVNAEEAREVLLQCQMAPDDNNPRTPEMTCPVNLGVVKMDVQEGPAGVTFMIRTGNSKVALALKGWYEQHGLVDATRAPDLSGLSAPE